MSLLDTLRFGKKKKAAAYEGASVNRRFHFWRPSTLHVNAILEQEGSLLRDRAREAARNNEWVANGIDSYVGNAIGTGIRPQCKYPDRATKKAIQEKWAEWCDVADAAGVQDYYGLQAQVCRAVVEGGECFARFRPRRASDALPVPLQIQLLESEFLPLTESKDLPNGNIIRSGIEFDKIGRRVAYHFYRQHPGLPGTANLPLLRVPASDVMHIFVPLRPGQIRGETWLARALTTIQELRQYEDAELVRKKIAAMFSAFVTEPAPDDPVMPNTTPDIGAEQAPEGVEFMGLEPGTVQKLLPGEDVKFSEPADVAGAWEPFTAHNLRKIAAGLRVTYEQLTGNLSGVNYSSIRAGLVEVRRRIEQFQFNCMVFQFVKPTWKRWLDDAVLSEALSLRQYAQKRGEYQRAEYRTPRFDWVDPLKDVQAAKEEVKAGFRSRTSVINEMGYDEESVEEEIKRDNEVADQNKFVFDTDPRQEQKQKQQQAVAAAQKQLAIAFGAEEE